MVEKKKKKGETFESMIRRFNKRIMQSGTLLQVRKIRFLTKDPNKNLAKRLALRRSTIKAQKEYLKKIGKLKDD